MGICLNEKAVLCEIPFIVMPWPGSIALAGIRIVDCNRLGREDALDQFCQLWARRFMQIDEQRTSAEFIKLLHGGTLNACQLRTALFPGGYPADHESAEFECTERNPILWIGNVERQSWWVKEVVQTRARQQRNNRCLPEPTNNCF